VASKNKEQAPLQATGPAGGLRTRRWLLGVGVAAVGAAACGGLLLQRTRIRQARSALLQFDPEQFSVVAAVADRVCPGDAAAGLPTAWELFVPEKVDALVDRLPRASQVDLKAGIGLLESALPGLLLDGTARPFTTLTGEAQDRVLRRCQTSRFLLRRTAFRALAGLINGAYWADPRVYAFVGYPGPPALGGAL
jgi:hypothetical protein